MCPLPQTLPLPLQDEDPQSILQPFNRKASVPEGCRARMRVIENSLKQKHVVQNEYRGLTPVEMV